MGGRSLETGADPVFVGSLTVAQFTLNLGYPTIHHIKFDLAHNFISSI